MDRSVSVTSSATVLAPSFAVVSFYRSNPDLIVSVPTALASTLGRLMVGVPPPGNNRRLAGPIGNPDAKAICTAHALYAKKTGLRSRQLDYAIRHMPVTTVSLRSLGDENYRVIWRRRRFG